MAFSLRKNKPRVVAAQPAKVVTAEDRAATAANYGHRLLSDAQKAFDTAAQHLADASDSAKAAVERHRAEAKRQEDRAAAADEQRAKHEAIRAAVDNLRAA